MKRLALTVLAVLLLCPNAHAIAIASFEVYYDWDSLQVELSSNVASFEWITQPNSKTAISGEAIGNEIFDCMPCSELDSRWTYTMTADSSLEPTYATFYVDFYYDIYIHTDSDEESALVAGGFGINTTRFVGGDVVGKAGFSLGQITSSISGMETLSVDVSSGYQTTTGQLQTRYSQNSIVAMASTPAPEPATIFLIGTGLVLLGSRKFSKN